MKKVLFFITVFVMSIVVMPNVYADQQITKDNIKNKIEALKENGGTITLDGNIAVDNIIEIKDITKPITIDLNGYTISRTGGNCVFTVTSSNITFKDSSNGNGKIDKADGSAIYVMDNATVTIESGTYTGGLVVWGENPTLNIEGGTVETNGFAVSGNGSETTNSTIKITGGTLTSTGTAAIYQPQSGTLEITGGDITGKIGIVARQGNVSVTGGTITANGDADQTASVGDAKGADGQPVQLQLGTAVIVDNQSTGYDSPSKVTISGGKFNTTATPVVSLENKAEDITVKGGTFDKELDVIFLENGLI